MEDISLDHANRRFHFEYTKREIFWAFIPIQHSIASAQRKKLESANNQLDGECNSIRNIKFHI